MIIDQAFKRLALEVAVLLTGLPEHRIKVVWRKPAARGCAGVMSKSHTAMVIEINPELPGDRLLKTYLHEVSHVLLHPQTVRTSLLSFLPSGSYTSRSNQAPGHVQIEAEAESLEDFWIGQARRHAYDQTPFGILRSLQKIYSPGGRGFFY